MRLIPFNQANNDRNVLPIFLISLRESEDRRMTLSCRAIPLNWVQHFWQATDLRNVSEVELETQANLSQIKQDIGRMPRAGEIGCAESHRAIATWLAKSDHDMALVLEDDVFPGSASFLEDLGHLIEMFRWHARSGAAFICHLGPPSSQLRNTITRTVIFPGQEKDKENFNVFLHADPFRKLWRAHAYILSKGAAQRQESLEPKVLTLADDWAKRKDLGIIDEIFFVWPAIIRQDEASMTTLGVLLPTEDNTTGGDQVSLFQCIINFIETGNFWWRCLSYLKYRAAVGLAWLCALYPYRLPSAVKHNRSRK